MRKFVVMTAVAAISFVPPALGGELERELGAHEHGRGTLNIAVEGDTIALQLEVPGMDIVGFEHEASSDAEKKAVDKALSTLSKGLTLFEVPEAAGCEQNDADVELSGDEHGGQDAADKDGHEAGGHTAFHVVYEFACKRVAEVKRIGFGFFKAFPGAEALSVTVVTEKGQTKIEVSRDKPEADLSGLI